MACERYRDALSELAAGALPSADVEAHLASCVACRCELATLSQALAVADAELADLLAAEPSPELRIRIRSAVAASAQAPPSWRPSWRLVITAAAAALFAALVFVAQRDPRPQPDSLAADAHRRPARETPRDTLPETPREMPTHDRVSGIAEAKAPAESRGSGESRLRHAPSAGSAARGGDRPPRVRAEPEVLVPAGEAEALLRFAASLRRRSVTPDSLLVADLSAPLPEPTDVLIQPLEIAPLDPAETSGTD